MVILGNHVTLDAGTGCVHTAPGHGADDYNIGQKYHLPTLSPVNAKGVFTKEALDLEGEFVFKANDIIIDKLKKSNHLIVQKQITHTYPYNPRSNAPVIFRATPQWFVCLDEPSYPLRKKALDFVQNKIRFIPDWGKPRLYSMIESSPDWCVSRQRAWGVPIPVFYCKNCNHTVVSSKLMNQIADQMEKSKQGIDFYFNNSSKKMIENNSCPKCNNSNLEKSLDILDVWFDSGICHHIYKKKFPEAHFPADTYLEGSDQHRGWFQTSLLSSTAVYNQAPFKTLVTHGFVTDAKGRKMSKSLGNVIDPLKIIDQRGAEILRLWVACENYSQDLNVSEETFKRVTEAYRRFRNTMKFLLGNLYDFDPSKHLLQWESLQPLDQWILIQLNQQIQQTTNAYNSYEFHKVYHSLNQFFNVELSAFYLDIIKDRLYTFCPSGSQRRSAQTALYYLVKTLCPLMAPITPFLSEETYNFIPFETKKESVLLLEFPKTNPQWQNKALIDQFDVLLSVRSQVSQKLEQLRKSKAIGSSLEAKVLIEAPESTYKCLKSYPQLEELFIVSHCEVQKNSHLKIQAKKIIGDKCTRCWYIGLKLNKQNICEKCIQNLTQ